MIHFGIKQIHEWPKNEKQSNNNLESGTGIVAYCMPTHLPVAIRFRLADPTGARHLHVDTAEACRKESDACRNPRSHFNDQLLYVWLHDG